MVLRYTTVGVALNKWSIVPVCFFHLCQFIFPWLQCRLVTKLFLWGEPLRSEEVLREACCGLYFKPDGHYMKIIVLFCNGREEILSFHSACQPQHFGVFFTDAKPKQSYEMRPEHT